MFGSNDILAQMWCQASDIALVTILYACLRTCILPSNLVLFALLEIVDGALSVHNNKNEAGGNPASVYGTELSYCTVG